MPSELITKNVDLAECVCTCQSDGEGCCGIDSPLSVGKIENILRLARKGNDAETIARLTYAGALPCEEAEEFSPIDGSPTSEHYARLRFYAFLSQIESVLEQTGK